MNWEFLFIVSIGVVFPMLTYYLGKEVGRNNSNNKEN